MKKEYVKPKVKVLEFNFKTTLLASSSDSPDDCGDNPWWCDRQPSEDEWWK
ncbi:MAG: hypothetical protein MJZ34_05330 [Paludibacteraceae bacterium]|nr:hypothetical protein [Paludibacteraceae bacterium]